MQLILNSVESAPLVTAGNYGQLPLQESAARHASLKGMTMDEDTKSPPAPARPAEESAEPHYEMHFTRDRHLIAEYKRLRQELYKSDPRFVGFRIFNDQEMAENYENPEDHMLIIHDGRRCYGGACLRISTPRHPVILDLEEDVLPQPGKFYFSLREHYPELELDKYAYAEFNRIFVHPDLRTGDAMRKIFQHVLDRCIDYRVRYLCSISDKVRARLYRQAYRSLGFNISTRDDLDIPMRPEYEGMKMLLLWGDMKCFHAVPSDPEATCLLSPLEDYEFTEIQPVA